MSFAVFFTQMTDNLALLTINLGTFCVKLISDAHLTCGSSEKYNFLEQKLIRIADDRIGILASIIGQIIDASDIRCIPI